MASKAEAAAFRAGKMCLSINQAPEWTIPTVVGLRPGRSCSPLTIRANTLKGEFDSIQLAEIVKELVDESGVQAMVDALPYT
jgi:hypothetical protein